MYSQLVRALRVLCLSVLVLCFSHVRAFAVTPFAANYTVSDVVKDDTGVHFTAKLNLLNPRGVDIRGAIVVLMNNEPHPGLLASFNAIKLLPQHGQVSVSQRFTVTEAQFARWESGLPPKLQIIVPGEAGASLVEIQAARFPQPAVNAN